MTRGVQLGHALSSRDRRAIRVGLLAVAPVLFYAVVGRPYISSVRRTAEALQNQTILLEREEAVAQRRRATRDEAKAAAAIARRVAPRTYSAADSVLAMSAFGRDVTAALNDAGLVVQRVEMRDSLSRKIGLRELTIDVRAQGDFESLLGALIRIEGNARLIHVTRLLIDSDGERRSTGVESLSLVAVIHGYAQ